MTKEKADNNEVVEQTRPDIATLLGGLNLSNKTTAALEGLNKSAEEGGEKKPGANEEEVVEEEVVEHEEEEEVEEEDEGPEGESEEDKKIRLEKAKKSGEKKPGEKDKKKDVELKPNALGIALKKPASKKNEIEIENADQLLGAIKSRYGQEYKDIKELPKFFETVDKFRIDSQNLAKVTKEKEDILATLQSLPEELLEAVQLGVKGEDYNKAFANRPKFDFSKSVDKHDVKDLINTYFPGEFTEEDFSADAPDETKKAIKVAKTASIDKYNTEKLGRESKRAGELEKSKANLQAFNDSVTSSVSELKQHFPGISQEALTDIEETLTSGAVMARFFNQNGTVKKEAAKSLALAIHGESILNELMEAAKHVAETEVNEDILSRGAQKPKPKKGTGVDKMSEDTTKAVNELVGNLNKKKTF